MLARFFAESCGSPGTEAWSLGGAAALNNKRVLHKGKRPRFNEPGPFRFK